MIAAFLSLNNSYNIICSYIHKYYYCEINIHQSVEKSQHFFAFFCIFLHFFLLISIYILALSLYFVNFFHVSIFDKITYILTK
nr:MAG TPA: hypothetical protein [Caudoviricetes sp.]